MDKQLFLMKRMILLCVVCVLGFLSLICYPAKKAKAEEKLPTVMAADIGNVTERDSVTPACQECVLAGIII